MKSRRPPKPSKASGAASNSATYWLAGTSMLLLAGVMIDLRSVLQPAPAAQVCQEIIQSESILHREELAQLLNIPERSTKESVRAVISEPYCRLPQIEIRAGVPAEREAYPLAFDPQTWFVVLYEGEEYAGYDFVFRR